MLEQRLETNEYQHILAEIAHLQDTGGRMRGPTGHADPYYSRCVRWIVHEPTLPLQRKRQMLHDIILDAFHNGYEVGCYIEKLKMLCEQQQPMTEKGPEEWSASR